MNTLKNKFAAVVYPEFSEQRLKIRNQFNNQNLLTDWDSFLFNAAIKKRLAIYDTNGKNLDRYTIVFLNDSFINCANEKMFNCIAASQTGAGVYLHCECVKGRHLGKLITFDKLDQGLQRMILNELID